jgi:hypothetical protein
MFEDRVGVGNVKCARVEHGEIATIPLDKRKMGFLLPQLGFVRIHDGDRNPFLFEHLGRQEAPVLPVPADINNSHVTIPSVDFLDHR